MCPQFRIDIHRNDKRAAGEDIQDEPRLQVGKKHNNEEERSRSK